MVKAKWGMYVHNDVWCLFYTRISIFEFCRRLISFRLPWKERVAGYEWWVELSRKTFCPEPRIHSPAMTEVLSLPRRAGLWPLQWPPPSLAVTQRKSYCVDSNFWAIWGLSFNVVLKSKVWTYLRLANLKFGLLVLSLHAYTGITQIFVIDHEQANEQ